MAVKPNTPANKSVVPNKSTVPNSSKVTGKLVLLNYPYQSQYALRDSKGKLAAPVLRDTACAPTSSAILVHGRRINKKPNINDEALYLYKEFGTSVSGTVRYTAAKVLCKIYNLRAEYVADDLWNRIMREIDNKRAVIFRSYSIPKAPNGHYILLDGYDSRSSIKTVYSQDPFHGKDKVYDLDAISKKDPGIIIAV